MQNPRIIGIALWWNSIAFPSVVVNECVRCSPFLQIERRIGHNVVHQSAFVLIICERGCRAVSEIVGDASDSKVHFRKPISAWFTLLPIDTYIQFVSSVSLNELRALDEHSSRTAARVIDGAVIRLNERGNKLDNTLRSVKFAFFLIRMDGECLKEVFIDAAYQVFVVEFRFVNLIDFIDY